MKHSIEQLFSVVYRYYPKDVPAEDQSRIHTEENRRLVAARKRAGADAARWLGMLRRLREQFPKNGVDNFSVHLVTGGSDACYSGSLHLPDSTREFWHTIDIRVSFLVPYYIIYSSRVMDDLEATERKKNRPPSDVATFFIHDTMYVLPASVVLPLRLFERWCPKWLRQRISKPPEYPERRLDISFEFCPDEQPYADWIAKEIETTWEYERMPPEIGKIIVPDVATDYRLLGEATLCDCLFSHDITPRERSSLDSKLKETQGT